MRNAGLLLNQRDAASEGYSLRRGPSFELDQIVVIDQKAGIARRTDDRHDAVVATFAPFDEIAIGMAIAFTEMADNRFEGRRHVGNDGAVENDGWTGHDDIPLCAWR